MQTVTFLLGLTVLSVISPLEAAMEKPVYDSPEQVQPLKQGDRAPGGALQDLHGKDVDLGALMAGKPTILIFYRGGWCPYCNTQMGQLSTVELELSKLGYQVLAVTPDQPSSLRASLEKHKLRYTLLSDRAMLVTRSYGLAYHVPAATLEGMVKFGVDLDRSTGNSLHQLPVPAAYVVDSKGTIQFVYYNPDFKVRVKMDDLMKAAKAAKG